MFASRMIPGRRIAAVAMLLGLLALPSEADADPVTLDFFGTDDFRFRLTYGSSFTPTAFFPRFNDTFTITSPLPGTAVYPIEAASLNLGDFDLDFSTTITNTISISRGVFEFPGIGTVPDLFQVDAVFPLTDVGAITLTLTIADPSFQLAANVFTDTVVGTSQLLNVPFAITDTVLFNRALELGSGRYALQAGGNMFTGTILAVVDRTQQVISEPSSLAVAISGFALLGLLARRLRRATSS